MATLDNARHERFIQNVVKGMTQRQAYRDVYENNMTDKQVDEEACKLFNTPKVHQRDEELLEELEDKSIMSAKDRMKWLTEVIKDIQREEANIKMPDGQEILIGMKNADLNTKIKAIDTLNKMSGEYTTKLEGNIAIEKLEDVL